MKEMQKQIESMSKQIGDDDSEVVDIENDA
jgi:hypothetical protein